MAHVRTARGDAFGLLETARANGEVTAQRRRRGLQFHTVDDDIPRAQIARPGAVLVDTRRLGTIGGLVVNASRTAISDFMTASAYE
jgi:hypothetical protein